MPSATGLEQPTIRQSPIAEENPQLEWSTEENGVGKYKSNAQRQWGQLIREWWSDISAFEWDILIASTCLKLLLFPA